MVEIWYNYNNFDYIKRSLIKRNLSNTPKDKEGINMYEDYIKKFNIIETYKTTNFQKIFIGSTVDNENQPVLINVLLDKALLNTISQHQLENVFDNLVHMEKNQNQIVLVTRINNNALPLDIFLEENPLIEKDKINLLYNYLKKIIQYDVLPNSFKNSLIDPSQIAIKDNKIFFDEIIILNENSLNIDDFSPVAKEISAFIKKIISDDTIKDVENTVSNKILDFAEDLATSPHNYRNFQEVLDSFKNIFIYDFLDKKDISPSKSSYIDKNSYVDKNIKTKKNNYKAFLAVAAIIALLTIGYGYYNHIGDIKDSNNQLASEIAKPIAYFEKQQEDTIWKFVNKSFIEKTDASIEEFLWQVIKDDEVIEEISTEDLSLKFKEDGIYTISLKVKDSLNNWSDEYIETIKISTDVEENSKIASTDMEEEGLDINFLNQELVSKDSSVFRKGNYSFKFQRSKDDILPSIEVKNLNKEEHLNLSMWVKSSKLNPFTIYLKGYNDKSQMIYKNAISHLPKSTDSWDMVAVDLETNKIHSVKILLSNDIEEVWVADIEITSYK